MSVSPKANIDHQKPGIVSILGSDNYEMMRNKAACLRRTLSADMSSKKWLAQNGLYPMKNIASSEEHVAISSSSSDQENEYELRPGQDEVWRSIQSRKDKNNDDEKPQGRTFGSILIHEEESTPNDLLLQPPYIHPLVKRSTSSLSEKSLEICTESLGSETGSDGFSSYPSSEAGDGDEEQHQHQQSQMSRSFDEDSQFVKCTNRKMQPRAFPPHLPSLAHDDGASLHMHCHRQNGRLVLEAVSVPSKSYFYAQRQNGRLLLTLLNNCNPSSEEARNAKEIENVDNIEEIYRNESSEFEDEIDERVEKFEKENYFDWEIEVLKQNTELPSSHVINVHKSALMRKKFNKPVNSTGVVDQDAEVVVVDDELTQLPKSLSPPTRVARLISVASPATAVSFNAYEYFWREKPSMASIIKPTIQEQDKITLHNNHNKAILASNLKGYEQQNLVVMRGNKAEYLVPLLHSCNEPRRSLFWEPHCIATS